MRLYDEIVEIAREYMGVAAEDYVRRRIRIVQRGEAPETITRDRIARLAVGIKMTANGYMSERKAAEFHARILSLGDDS
jgi:hypothetical protein